MSFDWPWILLALLIVPVLAGQYVVAQKRRSKYAVKFTNLDLLANVVERTPGWRRHLPPILYGLAVATLILAAARPTIERDVPREEGTVILVFDVSGSMTARDIEPTRLHAARAAGATLIDKLPNGFQIGIVSFSNSVGTVVSPTRDKDVAREGLNRLVAAGGTSMGDAIMHALDIARPPLDAAPPLPGATPSPSPEATPSGGEVEEPAPAIIVLLSDGASTTGQYDPIEAAQEAKDLDVPIFTIALGTESGVAEVTDNLGRVRRIAVPPDPETLEQVSALTDAKFFAAPTAEDLQSVYTALGSKIGFDSVPEEITHIFALIAAVTVLLAGGLGLLWFNRFP